MVAIPQDQNPMVMTESEYLAFERQSETRHEYINGEVLAMTGASWEHNKIFGAILASLYSQLREKNYHLNPSQQRLKVTATGLFTYPDISVICGEPKFAGQEFDTITNPILIIEILSKSTELYDRGVKFQHYRQLESLETYLLISQDNPRIEGYSRQSDDTWVLSEAIGLKATYKIDSIGCYLALAEVYEEVTFPDTSKPTDD